MAGHGDALLENDTVAGLKMQPLFNHGSNDKSPISLMSASRTLLDIAPYNLIGCETLGV